MKFDSILMVDWSGGNDRGPSPKPDAIWACLATGGEVQDPRYFRNRAHAEAWITEAIESARADGLRMLVGFDFAFGYPEGFGTALTGSDDPFAVWAWFAERVRDSPTANNRFDLAGHINALWPGAGPFWGNGLKRDIPHLPRNGRDRTCDLFAERRQVEALATRAFSVWQLSGAGAVGSQVIMGLPVLERLRQRFGPDLRVWPFEPLDAPIALVEIWPSLIASAVAATRPEGAIKDAHQVRLMTRALANLSASQLRSLLDVPQSSEGWILGLGHEDVLTAAALGNQAPPPLRNDCFAMPQGAHWTPVDRALEHLRTKLAPITGTEEIALDAAAGRILAQDVVALRSHPPAPNSAVDGYGFAGPAPEGITTLRLVDARAAAGQPYKGSVPTGHAIRILTGANLPAGVDTVVLQEDVTSGSGTVAFHGPIKSGANARRAGEDMKAGATILPAGRVLTPADLGTVAATGVGRVSVRRPLRVGILSTGDELRAPGSDAEEGQIYDANRPMLRAIAAAWGQKVVDLGCAPDDRPTLRRMLDAAAESCDVILTSGGASAGDEDHMSALLEGTGTLALWRIAVKPGRPLALGLWGNTPVFGLPGNPVAAMVCALVFARPALSLLAGSGWQEPQGFKMPADFTKSKKPGRREYLRARIADGRVQVFASEGSGRVSGLSWATGLVELSEAAQKVTPGDPVLFIPFGSFGI